MTLATIEDKDIEELKFIKLKYPRLIPEELIESVKGRTFSVEQFYAYQEKYKNEGNLLYALVDPASKIHGYLWAEINALDGSLFVNTFSIAKEYWHKGKAIAKAVDFLASLNDHHKFPRIFWCTTNEKFFLKHNFKRSKISLMEYTSN